MGTSLIVNVYLPTGYGSNETNSFYRETITKLEGFLLAQTHDRVIIASPNRMILQCLVQAFDLDRGAFWHLFYLPRDYHRFAFWVDHIVCSSAIVNNFNSVTIQDSVDNFSDHVPMFFTLNFSNVSPHYLALPLDQINSTPDTLPSKINWSEITDDNINKFLQPLQQSLPSFSYTAHTCTDPQCTAHRVHLLAAMDTAANACFPNMPRKAHKVPGWNDAAKALRHHIRVSL